MRLITRLRSSVANKIIIATLLGIPLALFVLRYSFEIASGGDPWKSGDWLINYRGGFVRRGLFGDLLVNAVELLNAHLLWVLFCVQVALYLFVFWSSYTLYTQATRPKEWLLVLLSPAFLLFPFYDYLGGFRKEIIAFTAFLLLLLGYAKVRISSKALWTALLLFTIGALSHETIALTAPFFIYVIFLLQKGLVISKQIAIANSTIYGLISLATIAIALFFFGTLETSTAICSSLAPHLVNSNMCVGAIASLSIQHANDVINQLEHFFWIYLPLLCLALAPFLISDWFIVDRQSLGVVSIGFICIVPLFIVAFDWGRWIHIFIFFTSTLMLTSSLRMTITIPKLPASIIVFYLSLWMIPTLYASGSAMNGLLWRVISGFQRLVAFTLRAIGS